MHFVELPSPTSQLEPSELGALLGSLDPALVSDALPSPDDRFVLFVEHRRVEGANPHGPDSGICLVQHVVRRIDNARAVVADGCQLGNYYDGGRGYGRWTAGGRIVTSWKNVYQGSHPGSTTILQVHDQGDVLSTLTEAAGIRLSYGADPRYLTVSGGMYLGNTGDLWWFAVIDLADGKTISRRSNADPVPSAPDDLPPLAPSAQLSPEDASLRLGDRFRVTDISDAQVSPDGRHFAFRYDLHLRFANNPPPYDIEAPSCSDVWVARIDGSNVKRLSDYCDSLGMYGTIGGGGYWDPAGGVGSWSVSLNTKNTHGSKRWTVTVDAVGRDVWTPLSFAGSVSGFTPDGRFMLRSHTDYGGSYDIKRIDAFEFATGQWHPVWSYSPPELSADSEGWTGWSGACSRAPKPAAHEPTFDELSAALSGADAACTFARGPVAQPDPEPNLAREPDAPAPPATTAPTPILAKPTVLRLRVGSTKLRKVGATGLRVGFSESKATRVRGWLLHGTRVVGRGTVAASGGAVTIKPTAWLRARADRRRPLSLALRITASGGSDRPLTVEQTIVATR